MGFFATEVAGMEPMIPAVGTATFISTGVLALAASVDKPTAVIMAGVLAGVATQVLTYLREERRHRWDIEQRDYDRAERLRVAQELKDEQARIALEIARKHETVAARGREATMKGIETIVGKIDENTEISVKAFDVANHVNEKLVAIGEARVKQHSDRQTDRIEQVVTDTNRVVHHMAPDEIAR